MVGLVILLMLLIIAVIAPFIVPYPEDAIGATHVMERLQPPSKAHFFGTDKIGRDVFSRVLMGTGLALQVGTTIIFLAASIGITLGSIAGYFGRRTDPFTGKRANHQGVDFAGKLGAEIIAVADGVVTWSSDRYGFGNLVEINHGNGYATRYAHNSENLVAVGDEVRKGQTVALMGKTGRATGPNLHFEVLRNGQRVNPVSFIRQSD